MGPEGLEPSPARLRAGCAAANTWVPASTTEAVGSGGVEPPSPGYRPGALPLSYKPLRFPLLMGPEGFEPPPSGLKVRRAAATPRPRRFGDRVAMFEPDHREPPFGRPGPVRAAGLEPALSSPPDWRIARLSHALIASAAREGVEPSSPPGKGGILGPIDERAIPSAVGRVPLESTSAALQAAATPSQLPAREMKRPGCRVTPGPTNHQRLATDGRQRRIG